MRIRYGIAFLIAVLSSFSGSSQIKTALQVETGVNISSLPIFDRRTEFKEAWLPLVSPLLGVWATAGTNKRFNLSVGSQYYAQGQQFRRTSERYDVLQGSKYQSKSVEKIEFHQVSVAIMANYYFTFRHGVLGMSLGYRRGHYISGHYSNKLELKYDKDALEDFYYEKNVNPFGDLHSPAKRSRSQIFLALQYSFNMHWTAVASYSAGSVVSFTEQVIGGCSTGFSHSYSRGDIGMTVRYRL